jgi:hypothetical protein
MYSKTFQEILHTLFFAMADFDVADPMIVHSMRISERLALMIREEQRLEKEKRDKLGERMSKLREG